jgi:CDP-4-dehydro-6-deoxyglucose reductase, E1
MIDHEALRKEILEKVAHYCHAVHGRRKTFIPGKTFVPCAGRVFGEEELVNLVSASLTFWLTAGPFCERFEQSLAEFLGVRHCVAVNSGSSANLIAFMALTSKELGERHIQRGDEVIAAAAAFPTTVAPIVQYGAVPVFVDIDPENYNIDVAQLEDAVTDHTKAVFIAHTMGNPFDLETVGAFCREHGLWLIEDNCDALGSKYDGKLTGTFGDLATSSFYPAHHITTGEGGAVYTNNSNLARIARSLRDWGRDCWCDSGHDNTCGRRFSQQFGKLPHGYDHKYVYSRFGFNLKITDLQAAIGCAQLDKLPEFIRRRRENHVMLVEALAPLEKYFLLPKSHTRSEPSWFGFVLTVKPSAGFTRELVTSHLESRQIQTRALFAGNLVRHPCFDGILCDDRLYRIASDLTNSDYVMNNTFWFGVYPGLSEEMLQYVVDSLFDFVEQFERG